MSFRRAARAALSYPSSSDRSVIFNPAPAPVVSNFVLNSVLNSALILVLFLAVVCISCNNSNQSSPGPGPDHTAYVTLPSQGAVAQLSIQGSTGFITVQATSPITAGVTPTGLALTPSRKFLYVVNSRANTVSTFNVNSDGSLSLTAATTNTDSSPNSAVIDPSGQYLLVTNSFSDDVSVFAIDASSGALAEVAGSPFYANTTPTQITITHSGEFVYVTNPSIGMVTGFSFSGGVLTQLPTSPDPLWSGSRGVDGGCGRPVPLRCQSFSQQCSSQPVNQRQYFRIRHQFQYWRIDADCGFAIYVGGRSERPNRDHCRPQRPVCLRRVGRDELLHLVLHDHVKHGSAHSRCKLAFQPGSRRAVCSRRSHRQLLLYGKPDWKRD